MTGSRSTPSTRRRRDVDLLDGVELDTGRSSAGRDKRDSPIDDHTGNFHLRNLSMHRATSEEEALNLLFLGDTNRAISETAMNQASSRSHCLFTVFLECRGAGGSDKVRRSKLHLVDLALSLIHI